MEVTKYCLEGRAFWKLTVVCEEMPVLDTKADIKSAYAIGELRSEPSGPRLALRDRPPIKGHAMKFQHKMLRDNEPHTIHGCL